MGNSDAQLCLVPLGYCSSWYTEARDSADLKQFLGLEAEDRCRPTLHLKALGQSAQACPVASLCTGMHACGNVRSILGLMFLLHKKMSDM